MEFNFEVPSVVMFGVNKSEEAGNILAGMKREKVLVVCDKAMTDLGFTAKMTTQLDQVSIDHVIFDGVLPNPTDLLVHEGADFAKSHAVDSILAIGGGSVMDCAKAINILITNGGQITDYEGVNQVQKPVLPLILVPTTSGTASEVTSVSVVTNTSNHNKMVIAGQHVGGAIALCDPALTNKLPKSITAATGMDALTHAIEAYVSKWASPITDALALKSVELIMSNLDAAVNKNTEESRINMMAGSMIAGTSFNSALLGLVHSLAHPLSAHYDTPHGVANAIFLPYVVAYNCDSFGDKLEPLAKAMAIDTNEMDTLALQDAVVDKLHSLSASINIPTLISLGIPESDFEMLAKDAMAEFSTMTNPKEASVEALMDIMNKAYMM